MRNTITYDGNAAHRFFVNANENLTSFDIRAQLNDGDWQGAPDLASATELEPQVHGLEPPLQLDADQISISSSGTYALLTGRSTEDGACSAACVVDLSSSRLTAGSAEPCESFPVDSTFFCSRPGLHILQATWHPSSNMHFALLTSDSVWRLYCVHDLSSPEQRFELLLKPHRALGLNGSSGRQAQAFAFGTGGLWERFLVHFLCSDGTLFALCPVAPFGFHISEALLDRLFQSVEDSQDVWDSTTDRPIPFAGTQANSSAWLKRAFPSSRQRGLSGDEGGGRLLAVHPHALDEHVPALVGPLLLAVAGDEEGGNKGSKRADSLLEFSEPGEHFMELAILRVGSACSTLVAASSTGRLAALLVAADAAPQWAESAPQCTTGEHGISATRSEVPLQRAHLDTSLLLLDMVDLELGGGAYLEDEEGNPADKPLRLLLDSTAAERLYVIHANGSYVVGIPWLPVLGQYLKQQRSVEGSGGLHGDVPPLASPTLEQLYATDSAQAATEGAAVVGDALSGTALLLRSAGGVLVCKRPQRHVHVAAAAGAIPREGTPVSSTPQSAAAAGSRHEVDIDRAVDAAFGCVLAGPREVVMPQPGTGPLGTGNPQGQRFLTDAMAVLRERHVEFVHQAHHDLLAQIEQLQLEGGKQEKYCQDLQKTHENSLRNGDIVAQRLKRATALHENLAARLKLLAELHWAAPRPPSASEARFRDRELPELQASVAQLRQDVSSLEGQTRLLRSGDFGVEIKAGSNTSALHLTSLQMKRLRDTCQAQSQLISAMQRKLGVLEASL